MTPLFAAMCVAAAFGLMPPSALADASAPHLTVSLPAGLCAAEVEAVHSVGGDLHSCMRVAVCLHKNDHYQAALELYRRIRRFRPGYSYVLVNLAVLAIKSGDVDSARRDLERYLAEVGGPYGGPCNPDSAGKSDCVDALNNLGALEMTDGKNASAAAFYLTRAIDVGDEGMLGNVYANLGGHLAKIGDHEGAADAFVRGFWIHLKRGSLDAAAGLLVRRAFLVPTVASSMEETARTRIGFQRRIRAVTEIATDGGSAWRDDESDLFRVARGVSEMVDVRQVPRLASALRDWTTHVQLPPFYVHYYGWHDLPLNTAVADMFEVLCPASLFEVAGHLAAADGSLFPPASPGHTGKKRVGFVSSLIGGDEPHGLLVLDILRSLRDLFDFYVVSVGPKPLSDTFVRLATRAFQVGYDAVRARRVLASLELDCLVYAESMNDPIVHFLGYQRFAEAQILVMGSPVTSGIPTFDYFVSGDLLEYPFRTQLAEDHYSEQVVLFDGQAISFPREQFHPPQDSALAAGDAAASNVTALGRMDLLREQGAHIYLCFQSIQKIQPIFDHVLVDILNGDPLLGHVVLQASRSETQTKSLQHRIHNVLKDRLCGDVSTECPALERTYSRIHFLPRVTSDEVLELMRKSSVVLHPFPFGGSKTASDAINAGIPLVTYPQQYLRGRMASVFLKSMALHEIDQDAASCCIANSVSDYVSKALRLASDQDYRSRVAYAIRKQSDRIFDEAMVSFEWGKLLTRALGIRISKDELMSLIGFMPEDAKEEAKMMEDEQMRWRKSILISSILSAH